MTTHLVIARREIEELTDFNAAQSVLLYHNDRRFLQTVLAQSLAYFVRNGLSRDEQGHKGKFHRTSSFLYRRVL
jgi:hypothetical protein